MLYALSCNLNLSYSNAFLLNVRKFSYPNGIVAANPRIFCISQSGAGTILLSSKSRTSSAVVPPERQLRHPFAVSYLIETCGFSPEEAVALAKRLNRVPFDNTRHRPDFVLALLKDYGFDDTHITKAIRQDPTLLVCKPEIRLIPKFEFFRSLGLSDYDMANLMTSYPNILGHSLERRIIPCYNLLKSVLVDDAKVVAAIKGYSRIFRYDVKQRLGPNVEALRQAGVSESMISFALLNYFPSFYKPKDQFKAGVDEAIRLGFDQTRVTFVRVLSVLIRMSKSTVLKQRLGPNVEVLRQAGVSESMISFALLNYFPSFYKPKDQFKAGVDEAIRLGFDQTRVTFVRVLTVLIRMSKSTMESKVETFKKWGFSDDQIADIFRKYPISMHRAEEKIVGVIEYLVSEMGFKPSDIASCPTVLNSSLQRRIVPRTSVVRVLQLKGLLGKHLKLSSFILRPEKVFLANFVMKYVEHVPQLLSVYEGRIGLQELGFRSEEIRGIAQS